MSDLKEIVRIAHDAGMLALVDEPMERTSISGGCLLAMDAGADMSAVSIIKQEVRSLRARRLPNWYDAEAVRQTINLTDDQQQLSLMALSI